MENYTSVLLNTALIVSSIVMALVFLVLPLPKKEALKSYKISLRFLALAYIALAGLSIPYIFENYSANVPIDLLATSFETVLFSFTLITLFNPKYVNKYLILKHIAPTLVYIVLFLIFSYIWGNPNYMGISTDINYCVHPTAILSEIFLIFCVAQICYFTYIFTFEAKKYNSKIEDYYSETNSLKLIWVRYCFYCALAFSLLIISSIILSSTRLSIVITAVNIVFNIVFGLNYIQYPNTYNKIEAALSDQDENQKKTIKNGKRKTWEELKNQIVQEKYYLRQGVNIEEMAQYLKIGRTTLSSYINTEEGVNFNVWINMLRIEEAKLLLLDKSNYSLSIIAEMVGYSESSNFSRQFKLITNESPSIWRQQHWQLIDK